MGQRVPRPGDSRLVGLGLLMSIAFAAALASACQPELGQAPFLCNRGTPECPAGYFCVAREADRICLSAAEAAAVRESRETDGGPTLDSLSPPSDSGPELTADTWTPIADRGAPDSETPSADSVSPPADSAPVADSAPPSCVGVVCNSPPKDTCVDSWKVRQYDGVGVCSLGQCSYAYRDRSCSYCLHGNCKRDN